jgi:2-C-methyl-D-erythritol 4-phosphate cytidylyltransferase/2-C-methyl-D-erythritol 2,4-cyclodiphosphate synthase
VETVEEVVVVLRASDVARFLDAGIPHATPVRSVVGGERRQDSVHEGLRALYRACDVVLVHDAARPLVQPMMIQRCLDALDDRTDGVVPSLPVVDTLKRVEGDSVIGTVDRTPLVRVQTPQVFRRDVLARAYEAADDDVTDDAQLVERAGGRVVCVSGDPANIKVTYPEDLALAEALLRMRGAA